MVEQLSSDFIYGDDERIALGWVSVEEKDKQGELIKIDELYKAMLLSTDIRGSISINDGHSNHSIGKIINFYIDEHPQLKKKGIKAFYKIFSTSPHEDKIWNEIKSGKRSGLSIGGFAYGKEYTKDEKGNIVKVPIDISLFEVSSVDSPANPYATNVGVNLIAKGEEKSKEDLEKEVIAKFDELIKQGSPWAICTAQVGRENKEKYEQCVLHVKEKLGIEKDVDSIIKSVNKLVEGGKMTKVEKEDAPSVDTKESVGETSEQKLDRILAFLEKIAYVLEGTKKGVESEKATDAVAYQKDETENVSKISKSSSKVVKTERPLDSSTSEVESEEEDLAFRIAKGEKIDLRKLEDEIKEKRDEEVRNFFKKR